MRAIDYSYFKNRAQKAGILIMNEVGLDPGMDHMSAMKIIDEAKRNGSKVMFGIQIGVVFA